MKINELKKQILNNKFNSTLADIYYDDSEMIDYQKNRYINALSKYENFSTMKMLKFTVLPAELKLVAIIQTISMVWFLRLQLI